MRMKTLFHIMLLLIISGIALADNDTTNCPDISYNELTTALKNNIAPTGGPSNGGLDNHMWATVVAPDGRVCLVTRSGDGLNDQWLGSRIISAQKANTAIAFSKPDFALSTANLYAPTQPGGSLFGLQHSNPVNPKVAYKGNSKKFGRHNDPLRGKRVGGVNVFGGGLALYDADGRLVGALGVSGDTSCADHNVAWRVRKALGLDHVPAGVSSAGDDNIVYDDQNGGNGNGAIDDFEHPDCGNNEKAVNAGF